MRPRVENFRITFLIRYRLQKKFEKKNLLELNNISNFWINLAVLKYTIVSGKVSVIIG